MAPDSSAATGPGDLPLSPTRATVVIDAAPVTILPRRAPVGNSGPIRGRTLAIFPGAPPPTLADRPDATLSATVEPGAHPAFAVLDLGEREAADLGRALGLGEILFWDGRRAHLLPCIAAPTADEPPESAPRA